MKLVLDLDDKGTCCGQSNWVNLHADMDPTDPASAFEVLAIWQDVVKPTVVE